MREELSFCRICSGQCGVRLTLDDDDRIVRIRGDKAHALTHGYSCAKGVCADEMHNSPDRVIKPLKRQPDGSFAPIPLDQALAEIAEKTQALIDAGGPAAMGAFMGTAGYTNATIGPVLKSFLDAVGARNRFTSLTIDQSAKLITVGRMGSWAAGRQEFDTADVWMLFGTNPLVSLSGTGGVPPSHPLKHMKDARTRGMKLVVVDPRRTETARYADIHLQPYPGEDPAVAAGLLHVILERGLHDAEFCARHVDGLETVREAVAPFTPAAVQTRAGVPAELLIAAAELWAGPGKRGCAGGSTGPCMSPFSNLADHMIELLNVVCGRYRDVGEAAATPLLAGPRRAEVVGPSRWWERGVKSRIGGYGALPGLIGRELPCGIVADEILTPGEERLRAFFVVGGNPALAFPDQRKVVTALKDLELLVAVEPFMSATARLAHYVIPPKMQYERADSVAVNVQTARGSDPFIQFTREYAAPPEGSEVIDDWFLFWSLAQRMGLSLTLDGEALDMDQAPTTRDILKLLTRRHMIDFDEIWAEGRGKRLPVARTVEPGTPDNPARLVAMADDVVAEFSRFAETSPKGGRKGTGFSHLLASRRMRDAMNSVNVLFPTLRRRGSYNPAFMHPQDISDLGLKSGDRVEIVSEHGRLPAILKADEDLKPGVIQMSHSWGGLPGEEAPYEQVGGNVGLLIDNTRDIEPINAMARQSGIPVNVYPAGSAVWQAAE
jgi:anaerobic selenocysteine-containing dehydrogenase